MPHSLSRFPDHPNRSKLRGIHLKIKHLHLSAGERLKRVIAFAFSFMAVLITISSVGAFQNYVDVSTAFTPSGWLGCGMEGVDFDEGWSIEPYSGDTSIRIKYYPDFNDSTRINWAGIYWLYPDGNWGDYPDGRNLTGATRLSFWARGDEGGERAEFRVGGISGQHDYPDSISSSALQPISTGIVVLSNTWKQYSLNLTGLNLSHVVGGFCWITNENQNPVGSTIYLDDIRFEWPEG